MDPSRALRVDLVAPVTGLSLGPIHFDPLAQLLGRPLREVLAPALVGAPWRRPSAAGTAVEVFPLAVGDRVGVALGLGPFGELGLRTDDGLLVLTMPPAMVGYLLPRLTARMRETPREVLSPDGSARLMEVRLDLRGGGIGIPLGLMGELRLEAPTDKEPIHVPYRR